MNMMRIVCLVVMGVVGFSHAARAQRAAQGSGAGEGWQFAAYPILVWVPLDIDIGVDVPPISGGSGGEGGDILESQFDGAFFGGVTATNNVWRVEGYVIWASFGGDRPERPFLDVDLDLVYGDARLGRRVARDLYVTGGLRRVALKYDITLGDLPHFAREPGVWDPLIGIGWHRVGPTVEWHASFEGGGFGAGADVDLGTTFRMDWKPTRHFGLVAGYNFLYLKVSDSIANRTVVIKPTVHGPSVGLGLYF